MLKDNKFFMAKEGFTVVYPVRMVSGSTHGKILKQCADFSRTLRDDGLTFHLTIVRGA